LLHGSQKFWPPEPIVEDLYTSIIEATGGDA
jgi:hypothetical protein